MTPVTVSLRPFRTSFRSWMRFHLVRQPAGWPDQHGATSVLESFWCQWLWQFQGPLSASLSSSSRP